MLTIDRVATSLTVSDLEGLLGGGRAFPGFVASGRLEGRSVQLAGRRAIVGSSRGLSSSGDGASLDLEYAIVDLGKEKVIARYVGPENLIAFNRSVFSGSLETLEADPLLTAEVVAPVAAPLETAALAHPEAAAVVMPAGWVGQATGPLPCQVLPPPDAVLSASPDGDFTVSLRAAWWRASTITEPPVRACGWSTGRLGPASYAARHARLGTTHSVEGAFAPRADGMLQLEVEAPDSKLPFVHELFTAWLKAISGG
jgi:hypothetical protein